RILNRLGGIELSSAYACIKAISKKKQEIIDQRRADFVKGAQERGVPKETAEEIFRLIEQFGSYGFNASHSAAYALLGYQTAYLKCHYTAEFMACLLSSEVEDGNKRDNLVDHIDDARRLGVTVLPPDINQGEADFTVIDGKIAFGLSAVKGLGRAAAESIVRERQANGPFKGLYDFCERVDQRAVTRAAVERLIKAGAFDRFARPPGNRAQLIAALPAALQEAGTRQRDREQGQGSIFDLLEPAEKNGAPAAEALPDVPPWPPTEQLQYEKEVLDFYFSSHPLAEFDADLRRYATHECKVLARLPDGQQVRLGGMIAQLRFFNGKRGRYARCKLEDFTGAAECVIWSDTYAVYKDDLANDRIRLFEATVEKGDRAEPILVVSRVLDLEQARKELTKGMVVRLRLADHGPEIVERLRAILRRTPGPCTVFVQVSDAAGRQAWMRLGQDYRVHPAEVKVDELEMLLGPGAVGFTGKG
ncbi:MAG TPA: DNA polymerase III alpha subunit, partial [Gemmataceae bacterium]